MRPFLAGLLLQATLVGSALEAQQKDIVGTAKAAGQFATLLAAVDAAELTGTLRSTGPFTVFAPTDEAFRKLPAGTVESLLKPENRDKLKAILLYHVVPGKVPAATARTLNAAKTVEGRSVRIRTEGSALRINDATVVMADVGASNGVIHVIDQVLLPPTTTSSADRMSTERGEGRSAAAESARALLELAIDRGVPLYNAGQPEATSAIYEVAARGILALEGALPRDAARRLERGLREARRTHGEDDRAWALRRALDDAGRALDGRAPMTASAH